MEDESFVELSSAIFRLPHYARPCAEGFEKFAGEMLEENR